MHGTVPRAEDTSRHCANHTLLETLGRDLRELQRALPADPASDEFLGGASKPETLLGWLQSDIAANAIRPRGGFSPRTTARCRCTPVTARRGRLTCCARCCSGCLTTTRRWSRATSW
ncbi:exodeoxyribonuclease V gamma chain domain protein [Mycobacterium xenopi 4042]|uniref:Exodeoxyribonuclease V gamma chain domain protein n=1 Tax=Mycobacterium xenopi 4042 TaxID=1299334 RepID=X7Z204_MYCXE|nr:exodeoxyribonuclease V gamma chain domain protein [Mycobacterium xenopi 4042]